MHVDWTLNFWQVASLLGAAAVGIVAFRAEIRVFQQTLSTHAESLADHAKRLDRHEEHVLDLVGDVQRLVGLVGRRDDTAPDTNRRH